MIAPICRSPGLIAPLAREWSTSPPVVQLQFLIALFIRSHSDLEIEESPKRAPAVTLQSGPMIVRIEHNPLVGYVLLAVMTAAAGLTVGALGSTGLQVSVSLLVLAAVYRGFQRLVVSRLTRAK